MGRMCQHWGVSLSVEIALTADVAVAQGLVVGGLVEKSAIKAALEDRTDRGDGASLDQDAASAGGIDTRVVVAPGQRQDTEAGAKALLGMRPGRRPLSVMTSTRRTEVLGSSIWSSLDTSRSPIRDRSFLARGLQWKVGPKQRLRFSVSVALRPIWLVLDVYFERVVRRRGFHISDNA